MENRLRHLLGTGEATASVLAPVPWFPSRSARFGHWAQYAKADRADVRDGLAVFHPRYALAPRIGMVSAPAALFIASAMAIRRLLKGGLEFDLIDAHYLYPDGVAAVMLGKAFGKPVVLTARGSDVTQLPAYAAPRRMIQWAMGQADALISVSDGLKRAMVGLGAKPSAITVLRNGVDLDTFRPSPCRQACRESLGLDGPTLLSVGHLIERKGHHLAIEALVHLPGWRLLIAGEGPERARLASLARALAVIDRVRFLGAQPHASLPPIYSAADILVLASSREGWANVLLESMACGTPVVASNIPGNPEVVQSAAAGVVVASNTAREFATAVISVQANSPGRQVTRRYAEDFSWDTTSAGQLDVFRRVLSATQR